MARESEFFNLDPSVRLGIAPPTATSMPRPNAATARMIDALKNIYAHASAPPAVEGFQPRLVVIADLADGTLQTILPGWRTLAGAPGSQADFVPSAPVKQAAPDLPTREDYVEKWENESARQGREIERLRRLLLDGAACITNGEPRLGWAKAIFAEFGKGKAAPLPYTAQDGHVRNADGEIFATVAGSSPRDCDATAEFIARACNMHVELAGALLSAIDRGGMGVKPERLDYWRGLAERAKP